MKVDADSNPNEGEDSGLRPCSALPSRPELDHGDVVANLRDVGDAMGRLSVGLRTEIERKLDRLKQQLDASTVEAGRAAEIRLTELRERIERAEASSRSIGSALAEHAQQVERRLREVEAIVDQQQKDGRAMSATLAAQQRTIGQLVDDKLSAVQKRLDRLLPEVSEIVERKAEASAETQWGRIIHSLLEARWTMPVSGGRSPKR